LRHEALAKHGCYLRPSSGYYRHIVLAVEHHGIDGVIGMLDRLAAAGTAQGDVRGYIFGASDALDARTRPRLADLAKAEREAEIENASQRELQRTTRIIEELTSVEVPNKPLDALVGPMPWRTGR